MESKICPKCNKVAKRITKGVCHECYIKHIWQRKKEVCPRCKRLLPLKAKGLCGGCYTTLFRLEYNKAANYKKRYNLDLKTYRKITEKCIICGFDKFVALHHLDQDRKNNSESNLVGLCPNHHQMLHTSKYRLEIFQLLKEKGFNPQEKTLSGAQES